jgi:lysophospholipase L1-like esterase
LLHEVQTERWVRDAITAADGVVIAIGGNDLTGARPAPSRCRLTGRHQ